MATYHLNSSDTCVDIEKQEDESGRQQRKPDLHIDMPDFDPTVTAKPYSPFYMYNHETPRPSMEAAHCKTPSREKAGPIVHLVAVHDLGSRENVLTPATTTASRLQQKISSDSGRLQLAPTMSRFGFGRRQQCMTKPREKWFVGRWLAGLTPAQRLAVKLAFALVLLGAIVGIAVGITIDVHGGFYKNANQQPTIGT